MIYGYYMHKDAMDVCIEIINVPYRGPTYFKAKVFFWNLGYSGTPYILGRPVEIKIQNEDFKNWVYIPKDQIYMARNKSGLPKLEDK